MSVQDEQLSLRSTIDMAEHRLSVYRTKLVELETTISTLREMLNSLGGASSGSSGASYLAKSESSEIPVLFPDSEAEIEPQSSSSSPPLYKWAPKLRGLTHLEALKAIAREKGGRVSTREARDIFVVIGLTKGKPRNVNSSIHQMLTKSGEFERVSPGVYKLIDQRAPNSQRSLPDVEVDSATSQIATDDDFDDIPF